MEGKQELIPSGEDSQLKPVIPPQPEQAPGQKSGLASRLAEIRANTHARAQKVTLLFGVRTSGAEALEPVRRITPEAARAQLQALTKDESIPPSDFLSRSTQVLQSSAQIREQAIAEQKALEEQRFSHQSTIRWKIDKRVRELDQARGLRRIPAALEKRRLEGQKANAQKQIDQIEAQVQTRQQLVDQLSEQEKPILQKREELLSAGIGEEIKAVLSEYEKFVQEVFQDGKTTAEIRDAYIQQVITPEVDKIIEDRQLQQDKRETFYSALHAYIDHRDQPEAQRQPYRQELDRLFTYEAGFYEVKDYCKPLLDGIGWGYLSDKKVVQQLVAKIAAEDIAPIKTIVESELRSYYSRDRFSRIFKKAEPGRYPYMPFWQAVKSSNTANQVFGEVIQRQDQGYYLMALDESLSDTQGGDIDVLAYYPTPDAIRNLVVIASADSREYRTVHANWSLNTLSKRSDWEDILDEAEKAYPTLKTVRPVLEKWNYSDYGNQPNFEHAAGDLALSIFESKPTDSRLTDLAIEALPNSSILGILTKRGVAQNTEAKTLSDAENFLKRLSEETWQKIREGDNLVPYIEGYYLRNTLRGVLQGLIRSNETKPTNKMIGSVRRLTSLSQKILDNQSNYSMLTYLVSQEVVNTIATRKVEPELIFQFPDHAGALMDEKFKETRSFIFEHSETLLQNTTDLKFLSSVVGEYGQKADFLIRGYQECLTAGVITTSEKELVLEFARQFRVISPTTLQGYKEAKQAGHEKVYIAQLKTLAERMTGSGTITEEERKRPYYKDLLRHVYANNSGRWSSFESNDSCADRSGDLTKFKTKPRYEIDLLSQSEIRVKAGKTLDVEITEGVQKPILGVAERMNSMKHDKEKINTALRTDIDKALEEISQKGGLQGIDLNSIASTDERLFLVLTDSIYGTRALDPNVIKNLVITYEFATFEDISDYIAGTRDRVGRANNQDYALLCEVGTFYSDRIKEVNRRLVEAAWNNPAIASIMPQYFQKLAQDTTTAQRIDMINKLQIERLGTSESFVKQAGKILEKRRGRKYDPDEVREIIRRYEGITDSLQEKTSTSPNPHTRAFYGQLRSQRERTFEALRVITGEEIDPQKVHLGEISLQQALETETRIKEGRYDEEQFAAYTVQRLIDLFDSERNKIEGELAKFESISGKQREVLYGYMTKSKESANARMVGGVCVAGDNPSGNKDQNMWNMPNYIQLVFQGPDTLQCQGLILLHHFNEDGKRVLTASINPSSTYLYSVDETALFNGIMRDLEQFAQDNNFDMITVSQNKTIRTNRTGGLFEKAMDAKIASVSKKFRFGSPQTFSYNPNYQLQDMDIIWERNTP